MKYLFSVLLLIPLSSYTMTTADDDNSKTHPLLIHFLQSADSAALKEVYVVNGTSDETTQLIIDLIPKKTHTPARKKRQWYYWLLCCN